jgi:UTP--glucose-1-phosphate uridylyltransferase
MINKTKITKAVIPAAGLGTRLYPISIATPKELFPIGNRSLLEYVIHESIMSGCTQICLIISKQKEIIRQYLSLILENKSFIHNLEGSDIIPELHFIYQDTPTGLGDAMLLAKEFTKDDDFAVLLPDNLFPDGSPATTQLIAAFDKHGCSIIGASEIPKEHEEMYEGSGRFEYEPIDDKSELIITQIYEKSMKLKNSKKGERFRFRGRGRYILTKSIYTHLEKMRPNNPLDYDEIPAIRSLLTEEKMIAKIIYGRTFDTGTPAGFKHTISNL